MTSFENRQQESELIILTDRLNDHRKKVFKFKDLRSEEEVLSNFCIYNGLSYSMDYRYGIDDYLVTLNKADNPYNVMSKTHLLNLCREASVMLTDDKDVRHRLMLFLIRVCAAATSCGDNISNLAFFNGKTGLTQLSLDLVRRAGKILYRYQEKLGPYLIDDSCMITVFDTSYAYYEVDAWNLSNPWCHLDSLLLTGILALDMDNDLPDNTQDQLLFWLDNFCVDEENEEGEYDRLSSYLKNIDSVSAEIGYPIGK